MCRYRYLFMCIDVDIYIDTHVCVCACLCISEKICSDTHIYIYCVQYVYIYIYYNNIYCTKEKFSNSRLAHLGRCQTNPTPSPERHERSIGHGVHPPVPSKWRGPVNGVVKGKIYRKPWFLPSNCWGFPVNFPIIQFYEPEVQNNGKTGQNIQKTGWEIGPKLLFLQICASKQSKWNCLRWLNHASRSTRLMYINYILFLGEGIWEFDPESHQMMPICGLLISSPIPPCSIYIYLLLYCKSSF